MSLKGRRVIVTGAGGFVGGHLTKRLDEEGAHVLAYYHTPRYLKRPFYETTGTAFFADLMNIKEAMFDTYHTVFHCAGVTAGAGVVRGDPYALVHANLVLCANVFEAAHRQGVKTVIFPSSTTGYPNVDHAVTEDEYCGDFFEGYRTVGTVKRFIEQLAAMYPFTSVALRISNAYGPGDEFDPQRAHVTAATVRKIAEHQDPFVIWGMGNEVRDILYIDDVIDGMIRAAEFADDNEGTHEAFNLGSGEPYCVNELVAMLMGHENFYPDIKFDRTKPTLMAQRLVDISKARAFLGWEPTVTTTEGLKKTLSWYKESRNAH